MAILVSPFPIEDESSKKTNKGPKAGFIAIISITFMRETYAYTILKHKTNKLRKETGNPKLRSALETGKVPKELFKLAIVRPSKMLIFSPIVFLLSFYMAIVYGYLYLIFTAMPQVFEGQYGFSTGSVGLSYLGIGIGSIIGLFIAGGSSDRTVKYLTKKNGGEPKPEYRLPVMIFASFFVPVGLFIFGWTAEKNYHWFLPILGTSFLGLGMICAFVSTPSHQLRHLTDIQYHRWPAQYTLSTHILNSLHPQSPRAQYSVHCSELSFHLQEGRCTHHWAWDGELHCLRLSQWQ